MVVNAMPGTRKTARRLLAADGYLDLRMPLQALKELDKIEDPGTFEASVYFLRGMALKQMGDFDHAIPWLEEAARLIPAPLSRFAWKSLEECYKAQGNETMASMMRIVADLDQDGPDALTFDELRRSIEELPNSRPLFPDESIEPDQSKESE
jgi:tetratricopeptide (TPR) repeat protein